MAKNDDPVNWGKVYAAYADGWKTESLYDPCGKTCRGVIDPDGNEIHWTSYHDTHYLRLIAEWEARTVAKDGAE